jgi:hypothetical protein
MSRRTLDYDAEGRVLERKFAVLRGHVRSQSWLLRKEAIAMQALDSRLPKAAIACIHVELRRWIRDGLFGDDKKESLLAELKAIDENRGTDDA